MSPPDSRTKTRSEPGTEPRPEQSHADISAAGISRIAITLPRAGSQEFRAIHTENARGDENDRQRRERSIPGARARRRDVEVLENDAGRLPEAEERLCEEVAPSLASKSDVR
jgi:hypothetical protein